MPTSVNNSQQENEIRFILDGAVINVSDIDPGMTVLQYLREELLRSGSKEGCAEGDCGACTVVIGELIKGRVRLRSVNACIQFLPMLHGKALFTVESLKSVYSDELHPVQQAMVDCHGSQCGFCTPGFIMSLFALFKTQANPDRQQINETLSGNLCRCTGYRPIIEAAEKMYQYADDNRQSGWLAQSAQIESSAIDSFEQKLIQLLEKIRPTQRLHIRQQDKQYLAPVNLPDLAELYENFPQATLIAGNTDVGLWVNKQLKELPLVISLAAVAELQKVEVAESFITIGAAVSLTDAFEEIQTHYPELKELFRRFASMPVRNAGTLVGNIANGSPIGDSMPVLLALQAELVLRKGSSQRILPLDQFYIGYQQKDLIAGEFVQAVRIPLNDKNYTVASYKVSKRIDQDISAVCAAFVIKLDESLFITHARIAFGGMAAIPQRALTTEQALLGQQWNRQTVDAAAEKLADDFSPLADMRASAEYRMKLARNLLLRFLLETQLPSGRIPVNLAEMEVTSA